MRFRVAFRSVHPYIGALGVLVLLAAMLGTMYFTLFELQWIAFLAGVLVAAVLAMVARASRAEWLVARRNAQLASLRHKLASQTTLLERFEKELTAARDAARRLDDELPEMVAYVDASLKVLYHNRPFREWIRKPVERINGMPLREVSGRGDYAEIEGGVNEALAGRTVRFERTQRKPDGSLFRLAVQYLPHFGRDGKVLGFYLSQTDITSRSDFAQPDAAAAKDEHAVYADALAEQLAGWENVADRLVAAFRNDEFCLYCQAIVPVAPDPDAVPIHEILVRLKEEEENLMPPGAFLPLVERHGLLPDLDRWVVSHVLEWISREPARQRGLYSVNVSGATMSDPNFPLYVVEALRARRLPGSVLCLEFTEAVAAGREAQVNNLVGTLRKVGCRSALSGFGRDELSFKLLKSFRVDYLKVEGNIVLNMLRDSVALAKLKAIRQMARTMGMSTVAELVEDQQTMDALREVGVDYAQGFGIALPRPLEELEHGVAAPG